MLNVLIKDYLHFSVFKSSATLDQGLYKFDPRYYQPSISTHLTPIGQVTKYLSTELQHI